MLILILILIQYFRKCVRNLLSTCDLDGAYGLHRMMWPLWRQGVLASWLADDNGGMNLKPAACPPGAVIFDCDGTLVDSETSGITAMHKEACVLGYAMPLAYALDNFRGKRMAVCFAMIEASLGHALPADFEVTVRQAMAVKFRATVTQMPGAAALLQQLQEAAVPYCIASNGPQEKMVLTLELTGLAKYFTNNVFSAYDIGSWKPEPELFLHAARKMRVAAADCAVVEDSLSGIDAGLAAGMRVYSMCDAATIPPATAACVLQIAGLACLPAAWRLPEVQTRAQS